MARAIFTPWRCGDCGAQGQIRHSLGAPPEAVAKWTADQHARKSPACHQRAMGARDLMDRLKPRDRHILITARIKRKLMADALRIQRKADREAAAAVASPEYKAALLSKTRKEWLAGKVTRKGYAFT